MPKFSNVLSYTGRQANKTKSGQARFATDAEAASGTAENLLISPSTLSSAVDDLLPDATQTVKGKVELATAAEMSAGTDESRVPAVKVAYDYINSVAIAGAPTATETQEGIAEIATTAEAQAGTDDARIMTAAKVVDLLETPPAIGGTTPAAGSFTTLAATGAIDFDAGGSFESGGAAIDIGADASADAINIGTGAAARTITIGNATGATQLDIDSGTGGMICDSTGAISLDAAAASNFSTSGAGIDLTLESAAGRVIVNGGEDAADCIYLHANAGTSETIRLHSDQGTGAASVHLESDVGGITLTSGLASADAINIAAASGGFDVDCGGQISIATSQNAGDALALTSSAGGIDILASGAAAGEDIDITATGSSVNITSTEAAGDAIVMHASDGAGGIQMQAGTGGILVGNQADCTTIDVGDIAPTAARTITIGGGTVVTASVTDTIDIAPDGATTNADSVKTLNLNTGGVTTGQVLTNVATGAITSGTHTVNIQSGAAAAGTVACNISTGTGTKTVNIGNADANTTVNLDGVLAVNNDVNANVSINDGTSTGTVTIGNGAAGAVTIDSGAGISLDAAAASNFTTSGAGVDIDIASGAGRVIVTAGEDAADTIYLHADAGTSEKIRIHSDQGTSADSIELESDVGGITLSSGLASDDAINLSASAGGVDIDGALEVNIASSRAATGAVTLNASDASGNITLTGAVACTPDSITSDNAGVAASVNTGITLITTDGDSNEDNVTLADGLLAGQIKHFAVIAAGNPADSVKITPANMAGGSKITFAADPTGLGCTMVFDGTNWTVVANNGGTIS